MMDARSALHRVALALLLTSLSAGCGAKTGLLVPDVATTSDATVDTPDVRDAPDAPDAPDRPDVRVCVPGEFTLTARAADMLLVVDRSGSMGRGLGAGRTGPSKWRILRDALASTLPRFEDAINVGSLFYPEDGAESRTAACSFPNVPSVDVEPATRNVTRVLGIFDTTNPGGSTPTAAALLRAYTWIVRHPSRTRARYIVLATDGAPNCNAALNPATCVCVSPGGGGGRCGSASGDGNNCLDDMRTVSEIAQIAANAVTSIPTYVIGIAGESDVNFTTTLTAMAVAGGRPNRTATGAPTFYNVSEPGDLPRAFSAIQNAIARCTFVAPTRPADGDNVSITLGGVTVPRDTSRVNGWDWTDRAFGELTLFGDACPADASPSTVVRATVACHVD